MYQVLYRKWRPQTFSDVYGQPHVTAALKNELETGRLAHAYLFTGSRGTGKTSCAKILAKAVNCLHPVAGDPCNQCEVCQGIDSGAIMDVVEIDAASNNGVDSIRELREEVHFTPSVARYRVYIIDEVHMLSPGAFNALLKTLEEPPAHVIFVLATTEVHKLPATILSRCQRFDFGRIPPADIAARIRYIAGQEDFSVTDEAALLLARLADGGLRDALSLLDQCVSRSKTVDEAVVAEAAGLAGREYLYELSQAVLSGNGGLGLSLIDRLYNASRDMERLCAEMIDFYRNLMIIKSVANPGELIVAPPSELARLKQEADGYELTAVLHAMDTLQQTLERLKGGVSRRVEMEMAMLRLCSPELDTSVDSLLRRIKALESAVKGGLASGLPAVHPDSLPSGSEPSPASPPSLDSPAAQAPSPVPAPVSPPAPEPPAAEVPFDQWVEVLDQLAGACPPLYGVLADSTACIRGNHVVICTGNELFKSLVASDGNKGILLGAIRSVTGQNYRIGVRKPDTPAADPGADDPLAAFLRSSQALGADVEIKR